MYCIHWNSPKDLWQLRINQHEISYVFCINNAMSWFLSGKIECFTTSPPIWSCSRWFLLTRTPAMPSTGSFKKQPRRSADWKKKTKRKFSWYILAKGVFVTKSGMKYGEGPAFMWEEPKMWFDLLTEDVDGMFVIVLKTIWYITFEASKCLGFWNFYLLGRPWLKQRHQRRSTRTCVKGRHRENMGFPSGSAEPLGWLKMRGKGMVILSRSLRSGSPKNRRF